MEVVNLDQPQEGSPEGVLLAAVARFYIDHRYVAVREQSNVMPRSEREARRAWPRRCCR